MDSVALCRKVLVLNDGPSIRNLLCFLKEFDRQNMVTASGEPLQASLNEKRFDAVVLDIRGPSRETVEEMRGIGEIRAEWVGKLLVIVTKVNGPKTLDLFERYIFKGLPGALLWLISHRYPSPQPTHSS
jgi:CheY-like chemotaxis protein